MVPFLLPLNVTGFMAIFITGEGFLLLLNRCKTEKRGETGFMKGEV